MKKYYFETNGKSYSTDRETIKLLKNYNKQSLSESFLAVFTLGIKTGRIKEKNSNG